MKKDKNIVVLLLLWNKKIYGLMVLVIWGLLGPYLYTRGTELIYYNGEINIYIESIIKFFGVLLLLFLFMFFKRFLEVNEMEITYSIDRRLKLRYLIYIFVIFQLIVLPIYIMSNFLFQDFYRYVGMLLIQQFFLFSMFYMLSYLFKNTLISFGITIVYMMIMITALNDILSIFIIDNFIMDSTFYFIKYGIITMIFILLGVVFEKRFYH